MKLVFNSLHTRLWLLVSIAFLTLGMHAQDGADLYISGTVKDYFSRKKISGVTVRVLQDGKNFESQTTSSNGKYEYFLPLDHKYTVIFEKGGMVTKKIEIDSRGIPEEDRRGGFAMNPDMSLFESIDGVDFSMLDEPIGKGAYDPERGNIEFDEAHTQRMQAEIMRLMREVEKANDQAEKEADKEAEALAKLEEDFNKLMSEGKKEMSKKDYEKAINNFQDAVGLKPDSKEAKDSLSEAQKALDEQRAAEEAERKYNDFIDQADNAFNAQDWQNAIDNYTKASEVKPQEKYPKDQLAKAQEALDKEAAKAADAAAVAALVKEGDEALNAEQFDEAIAKYKEALEIIPDEQEVKNKIAAAEKAKAENEALAAQRAEYDGLIAEADALFNGEDYAGSIPKYEAASKVFGDKDYPKDQIAKAQDLIAQLEAEAAEAAELAEKQAAFDALIAEGDAALTSQSFDEATTAYEDALDIFPDDSSAKQKLDDARQAKEAFLAEQEADERYQALIAEADERFQKDEWQEAITSYEKALEVKNEAYPKEQIAEAERRIEEARLAEEEAARLAAEAEAEAARQAEFDEYMAQGMSAMSDEAYQDAISAFEQALDVIPDEDTALEAKSRAEKAYADLLADQEEAERLAAEAEAARQAEYEGHIAAAEEAFQASEFDAAIASFDQALGVIPEDPAATEGKARAEQAKQDMLAQMEEDARLAAQQAEEAERQAAYEGFMQEGKDAFDDEEYEEAIDAFNSALGVISGDTEAVEFKARAEAALADFLARQEEEAAAAAAEAEEAERMEAYESAMSRGDDSLDEKAFEDAISAYEEALSVIPDDSRALESIEKAKADRAEYELQQEQEAAEAAERAAEEAAAAEEKARRDRFNDLVAEGDAAMNSETYQPAIDKFTEALGIYPEDGPTQKKLEKAERLLADKKAREAAEEADRLAEEERQARLEEERRLAEEAAAAREAQEALDRKYDAALQEGDRALAEKSFLEAKTYYEDALDIKPEETYPVAQIEKIAQLMAEAEEEERRRKEREEEAKRLAEERGYVRGDDLSNSREEEIDAAIREKREAAMRAKWESMAEDKENWQSQRNGFRSGADTRVKENETISNGQRETASERDARFQAIYEDRAENMSEYKDGLVAQSEKNRSRHDDLREDNLSQIDEQREASAAQRTAAYSEDGAYRSHAERVEAIRSSQMEMRSNGEDIYAQRTEESESRRNSLQEQRMAMLASEDERHAARSEEIIEKKEALAEEARSITLERQLDNVRQAEAVREDQRLLQQRLIETSEAKREEHLAEIETLETFNDAPGPMEVAKQPLAEEYPQGVTEEVYDEGNKSVIRRIVVVGNKANEYHKVQSVSGTYYFKNGQSISRYLWDLESDKVIE